MVNNPPYPTQMAAPYLSPHHEANPPPPGFIDRPIFSPPPPYTPPGAKTTGSGHATASPSPSLTSLSGEPANEVPSHQGNETARSQTFDSFELYNDCGVRGRDPREPLTGCQWCCRIILTLIAVVILLTVLGVAFHKQLCNWLNNLI
ncbi:hypothetical protein L596_021317 [Steinernema carpocapsae]|uniref:Uncharacterized protein n=1 Tax=Steinernema carpocapsae TaxID=34508 RepID=A0A4U5MIF0_STECR|nr:hypothetical protein L596_021317 [Steinernema carpocapsae]